MSTTKKHVVFDVVGTCVSYDNWIQAIDDRLGDKLRAEGIKPKLLGFAWMEASEREYTYLSMSGAYKPFWDCFQALFYRMLWMAGIEEPRKFATDEDAAYICGEYKKLKARPGIAECFDKLRAAGYTVWALTAGDKTRVLGYFSANGISMPEENFVTCDTLGIGKPAPGTYAQTLKQFNGEEAWFAAAHSWDTTAAQRNGFKGAWCSVWEKEPCTEIFGNIDVTADTFPEMADKIIAYSS
ncbi:HAD-like protein [Coleophoma crateriformis]|uniref:HAD-like protein n=1 Tax=Coleophoma crateriformis TaxID=565419 RepID=A0A3D8RPR9_9HELO|nr:HAD-like protein [Coleophoma crateriformis]